MGQVICEHLGGFQRRLEEESLGKEELNSCPQTAVFLVAVARWRKDQRLPSGEREALGDGVSSSGWEARGGPVVC